MSDTNQIPKLPGYDAATLDEAFGELRVLKSRKNLTVMLNTDEAR